MPVVKVKGMSCQHCVNAVTEAMEALGATDVTVDLLSGEVTYAETAPIPAESVKDAVTKIGFEVVG